MLNIVLVGLNHKTSPIEIREQFFFSSSEKELLLSELKNDPKIVEAFILSTCNRTEIYASMIAPCDSEVLIEKIFQLKRISFSKDHLKKYFYSYSDRQAVEHILKVAAGLDSLVLGEKQILAQIKESFSLSTQKAMMSRCFNILANFVLQTGRKARRETQIDFGGVSVSGAAVAKAQNVLGTLDKKTVLILGSGKMSSLAVQNLKAKGAGRVYVMNRTLSKAEELAEISGAVAEPFWNIREILLKSDVCICSTGCPHYLIEKDLVEDLMVYRPGRQLVCIDISVPRNIAPGVGEINNVHLFTVDDLDKVVEGNIQKRLLCVTEVERIVENKVEEFYQSLNNTSKPQLVTV